MSKVDMALLRPDQVAKIGQLTSLGFVENDVFDALRASRGDAQKALARLEAALADKVHQLVATGASESAARDALSRSGHDVVRAESLLTVWKKKKKKKKKKKNRFSPRSLTNKHKQYRVVVMSIFLAFVTPPCLRQDLLFVVNL
jgi:hypothetical protein